MKFCKKCGNAIDGNAIFCSSCGARVNGDEPRVNQNPYGSFNNPYGGYGGYGYPVYDTRESTPVLILSFIFWQIGILLWLLWRRTRPGKARSASKGALAYASVSMPILGAVLWLICKDDESKRDYTKLCGICAIVGAAIYAVLIVVSLVLSMTGVIDSSQYDMLIPFGEMALSCVRSVF